MKIRHPTYMSSPHRKSEFSYLPKLYKICDHKVVNNNNIVNHLFFNVFFILLHNKESDHLERVKEALIRTLVGGELFV